MISMGKKYKTRDGARVRILCVDGPGARPVIGLVCNQITTWDIGGSHQSAKHKDDWDLVEDNSIVVVRWVNILQLEDGEIWLSVFENEEPANQAPHTHKVLARAVPFRWEGDA